MYNEEEVLSVQVGIGRVPRRCRALDKLPHSQRYFLTRANVLLAKIAI